MTPAVAIPAADRHTASRRSAFRRKLAVAVCSHLHLAPNQPVYVLHDKPSPNPAPHFNPAGPPPPHQPARTTTVVRGRARARTNAMPCHAMPVPTPISPRATTARQTAQRCVDLRTRTPTLTAHLTPLSLGRDIGRGVNTKTSTALAWLEGRRRCQCKLCLWQWQ